MHHGTRQLSDKRARHGAWRPATGLVLRRHVAGFYSAVDSRIRMAGLDWPVRDYSTLCRRQARIGVQVPYRRSDKPFNLLIPSRALLRNTLPGSGQHRHQVPQGWRMVGAQTWAVAAQAIAQGPHRHGHGDRGHTRIRVHLKPPGRRPSAARPDLLSQIPEGEEIATVTADGA